MTLSAEQYAQIAEGYEKASADPLLPAERRVNLAKEADWFRFLAQRAGAHPPNNEHQLTAQSSLDFEPNSQGWSWRSTAPFLTTLWITGAAVYLVSTVLFTDAVNLFGRDEPKTPAPEIRHSVQPVLKVASVGNTAEQANEQATATSERRHAITPDQPLYESPPLFEPSSPLQKAPLAPPASSEPAPSTPSGAEELGTPVPSEPARDVVEVRPNEMLIVTSAATIRNGPSSAAKKIGTASAGAELQVNAREKDWVQFVDPSSGNTGWIQSSLLAAASAKGVDGLAVPKAAKKVAKKTPSPPSRISQWPIADLPADEEFFSTRKRGLLSRRRILREGLLSPDFLPPE